MKKIGILTFMQNNYGAVLQAYALQWYIRKKSNHDVNVIDFTTKDHVNGNKVFRKSKGNLVQRLALFSLTILRSRSLYLRKRRIESFKTQYIKFSERYTTQEQLLQNPPSMDVYISGSDQVFNPNGKYMQVYYLGFNKQTGKKVAYAPSFGVSDFDDNIKKVISKYILDFDALSCRERGGAEFLSSIVGYKVPTLVDPTLLLSRTEWEEVARKPSVAQYIFIYDLNGAENLVDIAQQIQKKIDVPIVCLTNKVHKFYNVDKQIYDAGPAEFVGWIANAKYVVTDSFHGTVFSTIFEKNFYSYIATPKTSTRVRTFLNRLHLENRIIECSEVGNFCSDDFVVEDCHYSVNISTILEESKEYINNNIIN